MTLKRRSTSISMVELILTCNYGSKFNSHQQGGVEKACLEETKGSRNFSLLPRECKKWNIAAMQS